MLAAAEHVHSEHARFNAQQLDLADGVNKIARSYAVKIDTNRHDAETEGKPKIAWINPLFKSETAQHLSTAAKHKVRAEFLICSGKGSILTENIRENTELIYKSVLSPSGEFVDGSVSPGGTVTYYVLVLQKYEAIRKNSDGTYRYVECENECLIETMRVTVPKAIIISEEEKLEQDIKARTISKKREQLDSQIRKDEGGDVQDIGLAEDKIFERMKKQIDAKSKLKDAEKRLVEKLEAAGATEDMIEEAIEELRNAYPQE